ncbi:MAG: aldo/keto reductase [Burkholderiaceae bacterium]|nr:aldo/keto reductase [Burkholderiaceae bacterium]
MHDHGGYRRLGRSGLEVSTLCVGTMMFGDRTDEEEARAILAIARDRGINFIDTADVYSLGESERITGRLIAAERGHWVLATKVANPMSRDPGRRGLSRRWIMRAIDDSLQRLGTDHVDIYYLHKEDHDTPLAETVAALGDLVRAGKIRYYGVSNYRAWRIAEIVRIAADLGVPPPVVCQPYYNAMNRMPETEVLPACGHYGIGVACYSPIARGVLTGKYRPGEPPPEDTRAGRQDKRLMQTEWREESLALAATIADHAGKRGMSPAQFAVNWVLNNRLVTSAIVGPRTAEQMMEYVGALDHRFEAQDEALVDSLVPAGHPSTPGYSDPAYPIEGRQSRAG